MNTCQKRFWKLQDPSATPSLSNGVTDERCGIVGKERYRAMWMIVAVLIVLATTGTAFLLHKTSVTGNNSRGSSERRQSEVALKASEGGKEFSQSRLLRRAKMNLVDRGAYGDGFSGKVAHNSHTGTCPCPSCDHNAAHGGDCACVSCTT